MRPTILFVCVHNAGRSQLAAGLAASYAGDAVEILSAGTEPEAQVSPTVLESLAELGIDRSEQVPTLVTAALVERADVVVALKPGLTLPGDPTQQVWGLPDPAGWDVEGIRPLRDHLHARVRGLVDGLLGG